jgi:hypothetical protein
MMFRPLRGCIILIARNPMADAMGYRSFAGPLLYPTAPSRARIALQIFTHYWGSKILLRNELITRTASRFEQEQRIEAEAQAQLSEKERRDNERLVADELRRKQKARFTTTL